MMIEITIPNWAKYNPRNDRAISTWFRFQNDFFTDQKMYGCTDQQLLLFMFLLCEASKSRPTAIQINVGYVAHMRKTTEAKIISDLEELRKRGVVLPTIGRQLPTIGTATDVTNVTDVQERLLSLPPRSQTDLAAATTPDEIFNAIGQNTKERWARLYPKDYLEREFIKCVGYYFDNGRKRPKSVKGWSQAISSWLERGWKNFAKDQLPSEKNLSIEEILEKRGEK